MGCFKAAVWKKPNLSRPQTALSSLPGACSSQCQARARKARQQEIAYDAEVRREEEAAAQARHQQAMGDYHAKLVEADAEEEKFRKEHWNEMKQQHLPAVLQSQSSKTFNAARGKWCSVGQDGSTVCQ
jgi:hypothetical protein